MKPLLCIRHEWMTTLGVAEPVFDQEGVPVLVVDAWKDDADWPALGEVSGLVVLGGDMNADQTDSYPFLLRERELMRGAVDDGVPVFGVCLGAQLLARAMGMPVMRAPVMEVGFSPLFPTEAAAGDPLLSVFRPGDRVFHWHEDTFELPPGAELLATGERVAAQAYRVGGAAWGVQFHLEVDPPELEAWIETAGAEVWEYWGSSAEELRDQASRYLGGQLQRSRELFRRFAALLRDRGWRGPAGSPA